MTTTNGRNHTGELTIPQWEIMSLAWDCGEIGVSDARLTLSKTRPVARTTVLTYLTRLEKKGWLAHRVDGRRHFWRPTRARRDSVRGYLRRLRTAAFGGSTEGLVAALVSPGEVSADEIRRIRRMLASAERKAAR
jgi:predicted transcriptional regulator